jgi:hypothetical protein
MSWPARTVVSGGGGFVVDPGRGRGHFYFASTVQFGGLTGIAPVLYNLLEVIANARHMARSETLLRPHSGFPRLARLRMRSNSARSALSHGNGFPVNCGWV